MLDEFQSVYFGLNVQPKDRRNANAANMLRRLIDSGYYILITEWCFYWGGKLAK